MAEHDVPRLLRDATLTLESGDGTPKVLTIRLTEGQLDITHGQHTIVRAKDTAGDFVGPPRKGEQADVSVLTFTARAYDFGANTTEGTLRDLALNTGYFASTWTDTDTDSDLPTFDAILTIAARGSAAGGTYTWSDCVVRPGTGESWTRETNTLTVALECAQAVPTIARA